MQIMMCGAGDIAPFLEEFKSQVTLFEWRPICFLDGNLKYTNYHNYLENSVETVKRSDVVVFVINQDYGDITWQNEFHAANQEGITYIILCLSDTFKKYVDFNWSTEEQNELKDNDMKLFTALNEIERLQKTIITYTPDSFAQNLRKQLSLTIEQAAKALIKENRRKVLLDIVLSRDKEKIKEYATPRHREFLIDILMDIFQKKEVRKRVLEVFAVQKNFFLEENELINCLNDAEQGLQRKTIELLPELVHADIHDMDRVFLVLRELIVNSDDVGIDRRVSVSMLDLDVVRAVKELSDIPLKDVGTPRRIIQWIEQYFDSEKIQLILQHRNNFREDLDNLLAICQEFRLSNDTWKKSIEPLRNKLRNSL